GVPSMNSFPWLTLLTFVPLAGALLVAFANPRLSRPIGLGSSLATLGIGIFLWSEFNAASGTLQFVERHAWVPSIRAEYFVGVDGLGLLLVLLSCLVVPFALAASWRFEQSSKAFVALL